MRRYTTQTHGNEEMKTPKKIELIAIEKLIPYAMNARTHSEEQVAQIAGSIREFGFTNPVLVDKDETIIAGHGRVLAARVLEMDFVPCIRLDHLTPAPVDVLRKAGWRARDRRQDSDASRVHWHRV